MNISKKMQNVEGYPSRVGTQILGLIPQSQVGKFLKCASSQIANPQICNDYSANFLCKVSDPGPQCFASNIFFIYVRIF
jgi:hypothetical protein